jgi:LPS export ABC transporter protein LptC
MGAAGPKGCCTCTTVSTSGPGKAMAVWSFDPLRRSVLGFALLALVLTGCRGKPPSTPRGDEIRVPDQEARDFTLTESSEGKKSWTLWASYAAMFHDRSLVDARTVRIDFFDDQGERNSTLVANQGLVNQRTNDLEARGRVRIQTTTGVVLETDSLRWVNARGRIVSDAFVRVTRGGDVVTGYGFESDPSLDHFQLTREVKAQVRDEGNEAGDLDGAGP